MNIEIDNLSGFCYGVTRAIDTAQNLLEGSCNGKKRLYSLGDIVHNNSEMERLKKKGLHVINIEEMREIKDESVLIRAHGEPPSTYELSKKNDITLIDCTCPVVLALQKKISLTKGQIIIFGKIGHAEVNGLVGRADGNAVVVENLKDLIRVFEEKRILLTKPIHIFSQTTKDPIEYQDLCNYIKERIENPDLLTINNTICKTVINRHNQIVEFAKKHNVILFVCGKESSNGHVLFELCKQANKKSYLIQSLNQIDKSWFNKGNSIGICGATSTPRWQLESVYKFLKVTLNNYICSKLYKLLYGNYSRF